MEHLDGGTGDDIPALFREVNERVLEVNSTFGRTVRLADFVCECSDPECTERLTLSMEDFEAVREHPERYLVRPGHVVADLERTLETREGFAIVERLTAVGSFGPSVAA